MDINKVELANGNDAYVQTGLIRKLINDEMFDPSIITDISNVRNKIKVTSSTQQVPGQVAGTNDNTNSNSGKIAIQDVDGNATYIDGDDIGMMRLAMDNDLKSGNKEGSQKFADIFVIGSHENGSQHDTAEIEINGEKRKIDIEVLKTLHKKNEIKFTERSGVL